MPSLLESGVPYVSKDPSASFFSGQEIWVTWFGTFLLLVLKAPPFSVASQNIIPATQRHVRPFLWIVIKLGRDVCPVSVNAGWRSVVEKRRVRLRATKSQTARPQIIHLSYLHIFYNMFCSMTRTHAQTWN